MLDKIKKLIGLDVEVTMAYKDRDRGYSHNSEGKILSYDETTGIVKFQPKVMTINKSNITSFGIDMETEENGT